LPTAAGFARAGEEEVKVCTVRETYFAETETPQELSNGYHISVEGGDK